MTLTIVGGGYVVGNLVSGLAALAGKKMFDDQRHIGGYGEQAVFPPICAHRFDTLP